MKKYYICGDWVNHLMLGVHRFAYYILKNTDKILSTDNLWDLQLILLIPRDTKWVPQFQNIRVKKIGFIGRNGTFTYKIMIRVWQQLVFPLYVLLHRGEGIDLSLALPRHGVKLYAIHDCIVEKFYLQENKNLYNLLYTKSVRKIAEDPAKQIITVSEFSKKDLMELYGIAPSRISLVGNGWEHMLDITEDESVFDRLPFDRENKYCFTLGGKNKHKNIEMIFRLAWRNPAYRFVVTGHDFAGYDRHKDAPNNVVMTGYLSDGEIKALMKHCTVFIQPSFYEGFGIPPLEALSLGVPVLASNASSLPEIYGNAVHYLDPYGDGCLIDDVLTEKTDSPEAVLQKYTWENASEQFLNAICAISNET